MVVKLLILFLVLIPGFVEAKSGPYLELRYSLFSNKPSVIGSSECPCYGSELILGYEHKWKDLSVDFNNVWVYQTRWDDPEIVKYNLLIDYKHTKWFNWLGGYEIVHNLDRPAVIPYNSQIEWDGVKHIKSKDDYFGISGIHYIWVGFRVELP